MDWEVEFFEDSRGKQPVRIFLAELESKPRAKVLQAVQMLVEFGVELPFPYSSQVKGRLRELRTRFGGMHYRIFYYADPNRVFVLLHGIVKKSTRLPQTEVDIALQRMETDRTDKQAGGTHGKE